MSSGTYRQPDPDEKSSSNLVDLAQARDRYRTPDASTAQPSTGGGGPPPGPTAADRKLAAKRRNESVKLIVSSLNGLGMGLIAIGFLQPLLKDVVLLIREPHWGWVGIGLALHGFSHFIIHTELQRED